MRIMVALFLLLAGCQSNHVRYDDSAGTPGGYVDLCKREPEAPECGGKK